MRFLMGPLPLHMLLDDLALCFLFAGIDAPLAGLKNTANGILIPRARIASKQAAQSLSMLRHGGGQF